MGNASALAYDILDQVPFTGVSAWQLNDATKKVEKVDDLKEAVSIFRLSVKTSSADDLALAQRNIQKLKTLRHPNVLTFIESAEMDDSLVLVTESVTPLELWLKDMTRNEDGSIAEQDAIQAQELIWGFKCILSALNFLHTSGNLLHGNLGLHSIFITPGGDWKLGGMELSVKLSAPEDVAYFCQHHSKLDEYYCSPERRRLSVSSSSQDIREVLTAKIPPFYIDMYSLAQCIQKAFSALRIELPRAINKYMSAMQHADMKKRPSAQKLSQSAMFNSEHIMFLDELASLKLKAPKEFIETVNKLLSTEKLSGLTRSVCAYKILPTTAKIMQIAVNDFPQRDAREGCRQSVQVSLNLLSQLASLQKIDEKEFHKSCVPVLVSLWAMGDRTVRSAMLGALKLLAPFLPSSVINKHVFDNMVAGFSDSNPKLREATLMNLIYVVDKLDENVLQDRLVRVVVNLQNDVEPSIRTNTTIFIGKIAPRMKDSVRTRVLANSLIKAMKDNFMHCRIAGLRTAAACLKLLEVPVIAAKILPQAGVLCVDKSADVRRLALALIENCLSSLRNFHENSLRKSTTQKEGGAGIPIKSDGSSRGGIAEIQINAQQQQGDSSSWSSWSVLQGLSKTLESAALGSAATQSSSSSSGQSEPSRSSAVDLSGGASVPAVASGRQSDVAVAGVVGEDKGMEETFGDMDVQQLQEQEECGVDDAVQRDLDEDQESGIGGSINNGNAGWDNDLDLDDLNLDDGNDNNNFEEDQSSSQISAMSFSSTPREPSSGSLAALSMSGVPSAAERSISDNSAASAMSPVGDSRAASSVRSSSRAGAGVAGTALMKKKVSNGAKESSAKLPKVLVKKLAVDNSEADNWDDF